MKFNRLNIGIIRADLKEKDNSIGTFERTDLQGEMYNYAEVTQVWQPTNEFERKIYEHRVLNMNQSPMLVQVGDIIRIPSNREPIIDEDSTRYVLVHQKDILEWFEPSFEEKIDKLQEKFNKSV